MLLNTHTHTQYTDRGPTNTFTAIQTLYLLERISLVPASVISRIISYTRTSPSIDMDIKRVPSLLRLSTTSLAIELYAYSSWAYSLWEPSFSRLCQSPYAIDQCAYIGCLLFWCLFCFVSFFCFVFGVHVRIESYNITMYKHTVE